MEKTHLELMLEITTLVYTFNKIASQIGLNQGISFTQTVGSINIIHFHEFQKTDDEVKEYKLLGSCVKGFGEQYDYHISIQNLQNAVDYLNKKVSSIQI